MRNRFITRLSIYTITITVVLMAAAASAIYFVAYHRIMEQTINASQRSIDNTARVINTQLSMTENLINNIERVIMEGAFSAHLADSCAVYVKHIVSRNNAIVGSALAFEPYQFSNSKKYMMVYATQDAKNNVFIKNLGDSVNYNYFKMPWYNEPISTGKSYWSEPYFDEGGGDILMCTYSSPLTDSNNQIIGVMTADVSLYRIGQIIEQASKDEPGEALLYSSKNKVLYHPNDDYVMNATDSITIVIDPNMVMLTAPIPCSGWTIARLISVDELRQPARTLLRFLLIISGIAILLMVVGLYLVIYTLTMPKVQEKQSMRAELDVAHRIRERVRHKFVPTLPERKELKVASSILLAEDIRGDFYNAVLTDERLYIMVGGTGSRGVDASLDIATVAKAFILAIPGSVDSAEIITAMRSLVEADIDNYCRIFVAVIDIAESTINACNAGYVSPLIMTLDGTVSSLAIPVQHPLKRGDEHTLTSKQTRIVPDSRLLFYSPGITDAIDGNGATFGHDRLVAALHETLEIKDANAALGMINKQIEAFIGSTLQPNDRILVLADYTPGTMEVTVEMADGDFTPIADMIDAISVRENIGQADTAMIKLAVENVFSKIKEESDCTNVHIKGVPEDDSLTIIISGRGSAFNRQITDLFNKLMDEVKYTVANGKHILSLTKRITRS